MNGLVLQPEQAELLIVHPHLKIGALVHPLSQGPEYLFTLIMNVQIARFVHTFKTTQWPNGTGLPSVYCSKQILENQAGKPGSLHAKCIVVDNVHAFVSSANFTEAAQNRNIEVGLLVRSAALSERLSRFFDALVDRHYFVRAI